MKAVSLPELAKLAAGPSWSIACYRTVKWRQCMSSPVHGGHIGQGCLSCGNGTVAIQLFEEQGDCGVGPLSWYLLCASCG